MSWVLLTIIEVIAITAVLNLIWIGIYKLTAKKK